MVLLAAQARLSAGGLAPYVHWSSEQEKDILHAQLTAAGSGWETPDDVPKEFADQINDAAKREVINKKTGRLCWMWKRVGPNHAWDCEAMQIAAALMFRIIAAPEQEVKRDEGK